jgi:hypothetical protein
MSVLSELGIDLSTGQFELGQGATTKNMIYIMDPNDLGPHTITLPAPLYNPLDTKGHSKDWLYANAPVDPWPNQTAGGVLLGNFGGGTYSTDEGYSAAGTGGNGWLSQDVAGMIPAPVRIGGRVLWRIDEIRAWLAAGVPDRKKWTTLLSPNSP